MNENFNLTFSSLMLGGFALLAIGAAIAWWAISKKIDQLELIANNRETELRDQQKLVHDKERDFLRERNLLEIATADKLNSAKNSAFEQGRQLGRVEGESLHLEHVMKLKKEFSDRLSLEIDAAIIDSKKRLTAEYELQSKLFTVQISPLVRVLENKGFFSSEATAETGYQYQLLVNGIPAFQPHIIIERSEHKKEVNEENIRELTTIAKDLASAAIDTYLGSSGGQFAKLAPAIINRLGKK